MAVLPKVDLPFIFYEDIYTYDYYQQNITAIRFLFN
jgi:hypothetical protein